MSAESQWFPWYSREWFRYPVAMRVASNWAGSGFIYARNERGQIAKFWTLKGAQKYANKRNAANDTSHD